MRSGTRLDIRFVLVCEGSSDRALTSPLEDLCIAEGADEVIGIVPLLDRLQEPPGRATSDKVRQVVELEPMCNLLFVHRDADDPDPEPRYAEIRKAVKAVARRYVAVVPVQATEAWILADKKELLRSTHSRLGENEIALPKPRDIEQISDPKSKLWQVLLEASQTTGRRRKRFRQDLKRIRYGLLENLDVEGPVSSVPSWQRLRRDVRRAMEDLRSYAGAER